MQMRKFFLGIWPLLLGMFLMMAGNSMQGALVAYRASTLSDSNLIAALIISGYAFGMVFAVFYISYFIQSVGHVRVFAALSAAVSASMLLFPLIEHPFMWIMLRFIIGFCYIGIYIVVEAWLNASVTSEFRGRVLSLYMITQFSGLWVGQFSLRFADAESGTLFLIASAAISVAAIPLLMIKIKSPKQPETGKRMPFKELYQYSPFASLGTIFVAMQYVPFLVMLGFFAEKAGMDLKQLSTMGVLVILAGTIAQFPFARLSDKIDRRNVIIICSSFACALAFVGLEILKLDNIILLYCLMFALAFMVLPVYAINLSHANDLIPPEKAVSAGSTIQLLNAIGATLAPLVLSIFVGQLGASGYFIYIMTVAGTIVCYALYRKGMRRVIERHHRAIILPFLQFRAAIRSADLLPRKHVKKSTSKKPTSKK